MKELAAKADERWRSVPSFLDSPQQQQPAPAIGITDSRPADPSHAPESDGMQSGMQGQQEAKEELQDEPAQEVGRAVRKKRTPKENPWQAADRGAPSENWQPEAWSPGVAQRR
jgi:NADH dehydrogenase [ubiquinone] 1 alpha subcomplex assembly factor 2